MKKVLIYGVGTFKNRGVEAIVRTSIDLLKDYEITIATFDIDYNKNKYSDKVKYIKHRYDLDELSDEERERYNSTSDKIEKERILEKDVIAAIKKADICLSAGGDNYSYGDEYFLYALDQEVKRQNKKLVFWGGSLHENIESELLVTDMSLFDALIIRESITYKALSKHLDTSKLFLIPDPAFTLAKTKVELDDFYKSKVVGINLSPITILNPVDGDPRFDAVIKLIKYILKETKYNVSLIPHVTTESCNDLDTLVAIYEKFENNNRVRFEYDQYDCTEIKYIISKCDMLIAARTHASIAAYSTNVPTLVIGYSVKSRGIAKDIFGTHENYVLPSDKIRGDKLKENFIWLDKNKKKIKKILEEKSPKMIAKAHNMATNLSGLLLEEEQKVVCNKMKCTGCGLCVTTCPHGAIRMIESADGFLYPEIDHKKCINCNLCRHNCPVLNNKYENKFNKDSYAIKNKNVEEQKNSTSGGVFYLLAKHILQEKGVVYGCEQIGTKTQHVRISKVKELSRISGTKYNQSKILDIYEDIKKDLKNKKKVLFSGTACQTAAIKRYVGDNDNLITVSVVCHGVISTKMLEKYIDHLEEESGKKLSNWKFRTKAGNEWIESSIRYNLDEDDNIVAFNKDELMNLFLKNMILRESCYQCMFKGNYNDSDIIIGDAWGINITNKEFYDKNGVSSVIINTKKGKKFFTSLKIRKDAEVIDYSIEDIKKYNSSYYKSSARPLDRPEIATLFDSTNTKKIFQRIDNIYTKRELIIKEKEAEEKTEMLSVLQEENEFLKNEISGIYNSKRWQTAEKIANLINKIRGRK